MERSKVEKWIRQQVFTVDDERGRCKKLGIFHVSGGKRGNEIGTIKVPKELDDEWITEALNTIESSIHDDAEGIGQGTQTYVLLPTFLNLPEGKGARCVIRVDAGEDDDDSIESEPATKKGLLSQLMRHNEALMRTHVMGIGQVITTQRHMLGRLAEHNEKLLESRQKDLELIEGMRSEQLERDLIAEQERSKQAMIRDGFETVKTLAPIIVNRLAGKNLLPAKRTAMEAMIQGFIESVTPEQLTKMQETFRADQMAVLLEVFTQIQKDEAKTKEKSNGAANKNAHA